MLGIACLCLVMTHDGRAEMQPLEPFRASEPEFTEVTLPEEGEVFTDDKPVMLSADQVSYDQVLDIVVASGKVEVVQGDTVMLCDNLTYDRKQNKVTAHGNVSVMEPNGNVVFADNVELRDNMKTGAIAEFKARMTDDSLFAARHAEKIDENIVMLDDVVYSPCKVKCAEEGGTTEDDPLWQLRADHVKIDNAEQTITYANAQMEVYGVPVLYTPYLSHATPNADGKSGMLSPSFGRDDNLGNIYKMPFYLALAPDKEMVVTPVYTSHAGAMVQTGYNQRFDTGDLHVDVSGTRPRDLDTAGNPIAGHDWRGHMFVDGKFNPDTNSEWGFDVRRTSDDTYLRKYDIDNQTLLTSRIYSEKYNVLESSSRNRLNVEAIGFQGLTLQDDSSRIPVILPMVGFTYESDPDASGGRYFMDSNALVLGRDVGAQSRRLSNTIGWKLPYISESGQMIEFKTQLRGDIYNVSDVLLSDNRLYEGTTGRLVPEISALWHYPFINSFDGGSAIIEPVVSLAASPSGGNTEKIPNEDSLVPEFTDSNLFDDNRFAGYDRIEHGPRVGYGLRGLVNTDGAIFDALLGQHYRAQEDRNFPFSNDLTDTLSDYVGKIGMQYESIYAAYRFRLNKETLEPLREEIDLSYQGDRFRLATAYLSLENDPIFATRQELYSTGGLDMTDNWAVNFGARHDLEVGQLTSLGSELVFKNECVQVSTVVSREYTRDREVKPTTKYLLQLSLKNLN